MATSLEEVLVRRTTIFWASFLTSSHKRAILTSIGLLTQVISPIFFFLFFSFLEQTKGLLIYFPDFLLLGSFIVACRSNGRHIVAVERDSQIFNAVLAPMQDREPSFETIVPLLGPPQYHDPPQFHDHPHKRQRRHALYA